LSDRELRVRPLSGLGEIVAGDDLGPLISTAADPAGDEIVVLSQKVVSKAEGRLRSLAGVKAGERAVQLAALTGKEPAMVELILAESRSVVRAGPGVLIVETRDGWICANAGIDSSNLPEAGWVALLPEDADASARAIRAGIRQASGASPAVVIADSFGRPWRVGQSEVAIGCAGIEPLEDWRGRADRDGRELAATEIAIADQIAAAADLARDKTSGTPAVIVRGLGLDPGADDGPGAAALLRPAEQDLFR
jgi:coenzyme F420-0:L-glutamate ligase/coenzyme F420-1:gamma-L-glutamate ligase